MNRRVIVPYTEIHPLVKHVLDKENPEYIKMTDNESYWRMFCELWATSDTDIIIIEHDIIPWPGAVEELWKCPGQWCTYTYEMNKGFGIHHAFGCTKIGRRLIEELPDVWQNVQTCHWRHLDAQLCDYAQRHAILPHPHRPPVTHLHGADLYEPIAQKAAAEDPIKKRECRASQATNGVREGESQVDARAPGLPVRDFAGAGVQLNISRDTASQNGPRETSCRSEVFYDPVPEPSPVGGR